MVDRLGRAVSDMSLDQSDARCGIAMALGELSLRLPEDKVKMISSLQGKSCLHTFTTSFACFQIPQLFVFFVPTGLGDRNPEVRKHMLNSALKAINDHGKVCIHLSSPRLTPVANPPYQLLPYTLYSRTAVERAVMRISFRAFLGK